MNSQLGLDKCLPFISSQMSSISPAILAAEEPPPLAVTISRQTGSGAHAVAEGLAAYLQAHAPGQSRPWTVFDRNLVERVLEDHNLPRRLASFMPEDRIPELADALDELLGAHPPSWTLVQQTAETVLALAKQGNVILIGRGANIIAGKLDHVFHVRLVGSLDRRVEHIQELEGLEKRAARDIILREDRGRRRYLKKHFDKDLDDPLLYHLVINTDLVPYEKAAWIIGEAMLNRLHSRSGTRPLLGGGGGFPG
jgi:cytidylate kinase